jgi:FkbM family methyltransferase
MTATAELKGYRHERGLVWPEQDRECARVLWDQKADIAIALKHTPGRRVVVQAGGNCGLWALELIQHFETVYTFEPDPTNFGALAVNTINHPGIFAFRAALGCERGVVEMEREALNCGAHFVRGPGRIPTLRIDDLGLPACDLIYLDIEGAEVDALRGAMATLTNHRPVVVVEEKGLCKRFGYPDRAVEQLLTATYGYRVAAKVHKDVVFIP